MFKILNRNREVVGLITSPINPIIEDNLTGMNELKFSVPATQEGLELEGYIRIENEHEYVIKEISTHGHNREVIAIMNVEELIGKVWTTFRSVDTYPTACIREIVAGTGWTVVDNCPPNKKRNLYGTQISSWDLIFLACDVWGIEVKFDTHNKVITTQEKGGTDRGTYFMSDLNLKQLMHDSHTHKLITRVIPIGKDGLTIEKVNGGKNYISNHSYSNKVITGIWQSDRYTKAQDLMDDAREYLAEMCVPYESYECKVSDLYRLEKNPNFEFNVGDVIYLIDNITKKKIQQRIIKHTKNLTSPDRDTINLANKSMSFTDYYKRLQLISNMTEQAIGSDGLISNGSIESVDANKITGDIKATLIDADTIISEHIKADQILAGHIKADQIYGEHIVSDEIDTRHLKASSIKAEHIDAGQIEADHIQAGAIQTGHIDAGSINTDHIQAGSINSNHILSDSIGTTHLQANIIDGGHINADSIDTLHIKANAITSNHIQSETIQADHIQTGAITAGSGIIADGAIGNAQISSLDANKIEAGEINTAKVKIKGENGFLFIENNTLYVVDNNRKIRCELGVIENNSNYGFVVRGADGQTIMLDHRGVHNAGITDGAIDNRKVSENANISGKKLDIDSVVKSINEDGSVTLKGTKVQIGNTTLDVKLSEQNNLITEHGQKLATQQSEITANTNAIKLKVDNQTYTADKKEINTKLNKATSDISVMQGQIALKVEQTDIENAIDELEGTVDQKITDAKAEITVTTDSISQRVLSTETTTSTLTKTVESVQTIANTANSTANSALSTANTANSTANTNKTNITNLTKTVTTNSNKVAELTTDLEAITQRVGSTETTTTSLTQKVNVTVKEVKVYYAINASSSTAPTSGWSTTPPTWVEGKYIWSKTTTTLTDGTSTTTNPVCITGAKGATGATGAKGDKGDTGAKGDKGDTGASGKGISSITNYYLASPSNSGVTSSTSGWTTNVQSVTNTNKYLWNYEKITYTDSSTTSTKPCIIGAYGDKGATGNTGATGKGIKSIVEYYMVSSNNTTAPTSGWTTTMQTTTTTNKYLWNYEVITYTDNTTSETTKKIIGTHGAKGDTGATGASGKGVKSITNYYLATNSSSGVTTSTSGWTTTVQSVTSSKKYLWNYEKVTYTDNSTTSTSPCIIGAYGDTGSTGAKGDKGDTGATGATGKGIKSIVEYYAVSSSNTTAPTSWSTTVQNTTTTNKYLWNYEVITYTDNSTTSTPKKVIGTHGATGDKGATGAKGDTGATGTGIESITTEYYLSTSKTTQTGGSWVTSQPTWSNGKYLWTRSKIVYKNPTSTTYTTPVCDSSWEAVNDVKVGGRNYIKYGKGKEKKGFFANFSKVENGYGEHTLTSQKTYANINVASGFVLGVRDYEVGKQVTFSYEIMYTNWNFPSGTNRSEFWIGQRYSGGTDTSSQGAWVNVTKHNLPEVGKDGCELNKWFKVEKILTIPSQAHSSIGSASSIQFYNSNADVSASVTFRIRNVKIEYGNKATDWSPAPEDMETTVSAIETRVQNAESKLTKTSLTTTIGNHYTTTSDVDGIITKKGYATTSQVQQTADSLSAKFSSSGGYNLLRNSSGKHGVNYWVNSNLTGFSSSTDATQSNIALTSAKARLNLSNSTTSEKFAYSHRFELSANKTYTISGKCYVGDGSVGLDAYLLISNSITSTGNSSVSAFDTSVNCVTVNTYTGKWVEFSKTYKTGSTTKTGVIRLDHNGTGTDGTSKNVYFADLMVTEGEMKLAWSPHPSEVYDGITRIDKDGIQVSQSNISTTTKMNANGFYINKGGTDVFKVDSGGLKMTGNITGSTFSSTNNIFQVLSDGTVETDDINVSGTVSTNTLTVDKISNSKYPEVLDRAMKVYIKNGASSPDDFYNGAVYGSFKDMLAVAPRNLQGYTLDIIMQSNITENVSLTWFTSGQVDISFQGYTLYGYLYCYGASMVYRLYGGLGDTAKRGLIMPSCGRLMGSYYYALAFQYCQFAINNIGLYPDTTNTTNSGGICANRGSRGNVFDATAYGSMRYLVRSEYGSHVYVSKTSGTCNNATFCATTGSIISINNDNAQAGRSTSGNPYWVGSGGMIVNNQILGMSNITFGTTANSGSNNNTSGTTSQTVTETITASLADTYRLNVYTGWKKDGTVRQGDYGYGDCIGLWFFDNKLSSALSKGTTKSVSIKITRQSGGVHSAVTHTLKAHNHTTRPSGAPTMGSTICTFSLATGASTTLNLTSAQITTLKSGKGIGLQSAYDASHYSVCSGTITIKVTYTT